MPMGKIPSISHHVSLLLWLFLNGLVHRHQHWNPLHQFFWPVMSEPDDLTDVSIGPEDLFGDATEAQGTGTEHDKVSAPVAASSTPSSSSVMSTGAGQSSSSSTNKIVALMLLSCKLVNSFTIYNYREYIRLGSNKIVNYRASGLYLIRLGVFASSPWRRFRSASYSSYVPSNHTTLESPSNAMM